MRYSNRNTQRTAKTIFGLCGLLFASFCFLYLYILQPDYLERMQDILSGGATKYDDTIGAIVITSILVVLGILVHSKIRFPVQMVAWAWLPSVYLLTWLTSFSLGRFSIDTASPRYFLLILLPIIYIIGIYYAHTISDRYKKRRNFISYLIPNLLVLFLSFILMGGMVDTNNYFHREVQAEKLLQDNLYEDVLLLSEEENDASPLLFSMQCYSLCQLKRMGSELFNYPTAMGGSNDLLPEYADTADVEDFGHKVYSLLGVDSIESKPQNVIRFLETLEQNDTVSNTALREYLLSAYLLDRDLSGFSKALSLKNDSVLYELPRHYREALVLEAAFMGDSTVFLRDTVVSSQYHEFDSIRCHDVRHRDVSRKAYGNTYWYYFFYKQ